MSESESKIAVIEKSIEQNITRRYRLAVLILAFLITGAFLVMNSVLINSESNAYIVNISGKQRMLSQHIALDAYRVHKSHCKKLPLYGEEPVLSLKQRVTEMATANKRLSSGNLTDKFKVDLSDEIREMYFGEMNLSQRVYDYTELALSILSVKNREESLQTLEKIDQLAEPLLQDLNKVVFQYQKEGEARLEQLEKLELIMWILALLVLLLEVLFIFRPMARKVKESVQAEKALLESLQDQVELRTMKLEKANRSLMDLATHDPLTGAKNRLTLEMEVEQLMTGYQKNQQDFAVVIVDIDWFKKVNDTYGHDFGDFVLKSFTTILKDNTRDGDEVYRIGGEEFVIVFSRIALDQLLTKLEGLRVMIQKHNFILGSQETPITASFGVFHSSMFPHESFKQVIKVADSALYRAKSLGRNQVVVADKQDIAIGSTEELPAIHMLFADSELTSLISADDGLQDFLGYHPDILVMEQIPLESLIYSKDWDLLESLKQSMFDSKQAKFFTIRTVDKRHNIQIARMEARKHDDGYEVIMQSGTELADAFGDDLLVANFHAMLENTNDYIYFKDRNHVFTAASKTLVSLTSVDTREELVGKTDYQVFSQDLADEYFILEKEVFNGDVAVSQKFQPILNNDGEQGWVDNRKYPIKDSQGHIIGLFGIARVISTEEYQRLNPSQSEDE